MTLNFSSVYREFANQEIKWLSGDSEKEYQQNLISRGDMMGRWKDQKFTYKFNNHGFRCDDFKQDTGILFLGCSYTLGLALPLEDTWTYTVAKSLRLTYANLGQGGGSNDTAFRLGYHWIPKIKPKIVFLLSPDSHRLELVTDDLIHFLNINNLTQLFKSFLEKWMLCETNVQLNQKKNISALEHLCLKNDIKFIVYNSSDLHKIDLARDLGHPGTESNQQFAQSILKKENWW